MKTLDEVYEESLAKIDKESVISSIAAEIKRVSEALSERDLKNWSADQISRALTALAVLRVNLGTEMADAMAFYDFSYIHRKLRYASEWKPTKQRLNKTMKRATNKDVESEIENNLADIMYSEQQAKHYAERLRTIYDATETLITALQSRLGVLKQERRESRYG